jgi:hypothetical protein
MFKWLLVLVLVVTAACQPVTIVTDTTNDTFQNVDLVNQAEIVPNQDNWISATLQGHEVRVRLPQGWQHDATDGLLIGENLGRMNSQSLINGTSAYFFVPELDQFGELLTQSGNLAYRVLQEVQEMPDLTSGTWVEEPIALASGESYAAYYLYTGVNDVHGMVLALARREAQQILVINMTVPDTDAQKLRSYLPQIVDGLQIGNYAFTYRLLDPMPEALVFPSAS